MTDSYSLRQPREDGDSCMLPGTDACTHNKEMLSLGLGVDIQQVNPTIFHIVEKIFAKPLKGLEFLGLVLTQAVVKQEALSTSSAQTPTAFAVISLQNIRELAQRIHWGYDTTHKYVVTFCALNLLFKRRSSNHIELLFPLQHYDPPASLHELDRLLEKSRPKVQQFARRVRERCLIYGVVTASASTHTTSTPIAPLSPEQELLTKLHTILRTENIDAECRQRLVMRISSEIIGKLLTYPSTRVSPAGQGRLSLPNAQPEVNKLESTAEGRLLPDLLSSGEQESTSTVDSFPPRGGETEKESTSTVDFAQPTINDTQKEPTLAVDSLQTRTHKAEESTTKVDLANNETGKTSLQSNPMVDSSSQKTPGEEESPLPGRLTDKETTIPAPTQHRQRESKKSTASAPKSLQNLVLNSNLFHAVKNKQQPAVDSPTQGDSPMQSELQVVDSLTQGDFQSVDSITQSLLAQAQKRSVVDSFPVEVDFDTPLPESLESLPELVDLPTEPALQAIAKPESTRTESTVQHPSSVDSKGQEGKTLVDLNFYSQEFAELYVTLDVSKLFNNIINNKNNTNVTLRKDLQKLLAEVFDRNRQAANRYKNLFEKVDASAVATSFIYSLQAMAGPNGHTIKNPAGFFTKKCVDVQNQELAYSQEEIAMLSQLTCEQMYEYLTNPDSATKLAPLFDHATPEAQGDQSGQIIVRSNGKNLSRKKFKLGHLYPKRPSTNL